MFDQPELEAILRANLERYHDGHPPRQHRGHRRSPRTAPAGCASTSPTGSPAADDSVLAEYVLGCDGANSLTRTTIGAAMHDLQLRAALARRRRGHRRRPRPVGGRAPGLRPAPGRHLHARRHDPLPLGVPAAARRDRRRLPRPGPAAPADRAVDQATSRSTGCSSSGWPSTPSAPSSPTGGATGGCSCSATPPTSPRRSSGRAWAPGCATRRTSPGNSPACSTAPCPSACWTPTRPNASHTPAR